MIDAEHLFSKELADFMVNRGYTYEVEYIQAVCNWRRASNERGLSELQRCKFNNQFLTLILKDLIPWYGAYDLSTLEVNQ